MGAWEHIKLGELPGHNALGFFWWERSLKTHTEIKRELFTYRIYTLIELSVKSPSVSPPIASAFTPYPLF
jgi:hypothetical protein